MRVQFCFRLLGAFVILGAVDSFVTTSTNLTGEATQPLMTGDINHQVPMGPIVVENSNLAYGVENNGYFQQPQTGDHFVRETPGVDMGATPIWPGNEAYQWQTTNQQQAKVNPTEQVGFFDVIRSLTNVFTGLVGRVNTSPTVNYSSMETETPSPIINSELLHSQHSEEDTMDEDIFDDKVITPITEVPISVRLAKVKQLVKSHFAPHQTSRNVYDPGYPPQYAPVEIRDPMSQAPAHQDVIVMSGEHVSENFGCNSRICLWKK